MVRDPFDEFFRRIRQMFKGFDRMWGDMDLREFERRPGVTGFRVEIKDYGAGKPEIKVERLGERPVKIRPAIREVPEVEPVQALKVEPIKRMLETNSAKVEKLNEVVLTMQTPGVSERDVEVRQLGQTLEVVARKPTGEAYFAAFELPSNAVSSERSLRIKNGMLVISIPRRRYTDIRM